MLIKPVSLIAEMSGKMAKSEKLVFYSKNGKIFAWNNEGPTKPPTEKQLAVQEKFKAVNILVAADMLEPDLKKKWEEAAKNSNGKYFSARGAAFAFYWASAE